MKKRHALLLASNGHEWHAVELLRALREKGWNVTTRSFADCHISPDGLIVSGWGTQLPQGVFVRGIGAGSLEQITFRLAFLHALERLKITVINSPRCIERTVDKGICSFLLHHAGLPTAPSWVCHEHSQALAILNQELAANHFLVSKPLFGSRGKGIRLLRCPQDLPDSDAVQGVWYLQRFIDAADGNGMVRDRRAFVVGERCVAIMERYAKHWIVNVHQGGQCRQVPMDPIQGDIAVKAARAVGADYAGVDLMVDRQQQTYILEVNGIPAWKGLEESCHPNVAAIIADHAVSRWGSQWGKSQ